MVLISRHGSPFVASCSPFPRASLDVTEGTYKVQPGTGICVSCTMALAV